MNQTFEPKKKHKPCRNMQNTLRLHGSGKNDCAGSNVHIFACEIHQQSFRQTNEKQKKPTT